MSQQGTKVGDRATMYTPIGAIIERPVQRISLGYASNGGRLGRDQYSNVVYLNDPNYRPEGNPWLDEYIVVELPKGYKPSDN